MEKVDTFLVSGILYDTKEPAAIINYDNASYFVKEGDIFKNFVVKKIQRDDVILANGQYIFRAKVAEAINSKNKNITPVGLISNGEKRVYSNNVIGDLSTDKNKNKNKNDDNYVSSEDIEINERQ